MEIVVLLSHAMTYKDVGELFTVLNKWNATMRPMHSDSTDTNMSRYFSVTGHDVGEQMRQELSLLLGIESAHIKPEDSIAI